MKTPDEGTDRRTSTSTKLALPKIAELSEILIGSNRKETIRVTLEKTGDIFDGCRVCFIGLSKGKLVIEDGIPPNEHGVGIVITPKTGDSFLKNVIDGGKTIIVNDPRSDKRVGYLSTLVERYQISGIMFSPLRSTEGNDLGLLVVDALKGRIFSLGDKLLIKTISRLMSSALQREYREEKTRKEIAKKEGLIVLGKISQVMVHSLRNPLSSLGGNAQRVKRIAESRRDELNTAFGPGKREAFENNIRIVVEEAARMDGIISAVWDLSRPVVLNLEKCNINNLLAEEVRKYRFSCMERKIIFTTNLDGHLGGITLMIDKLRLQTCIGDIVSNACDKSTLATKIFIGTRLVKLPKTRCIITVIDNGVGIEPMDQEDIFEPFMTKNKPSGTGLGLPIAKHIVEGHGGGIRVESRPGRTIFEISLPIK